MDLNEHYSRHQHLLIRSSQEPIDKFREALDVAAALVADRIATYQLKLGATAASGWAVISIAHAA